MVIILTIAILIVLRTILKGIEEERKFEKERKERIKKHDDLMQDLRNKGILK